MKPAPRVQFILKLRESYDYGCEYGGGGTGVHLSGGLFNSAHFVYEMLLAAGVAADFVQVVDNNDIDREVARFRPTHVIIEALWVVPDKFEVLTRLHPTVKWIVRTHSEIPFLATEGIAIEWLREYIQRFPEVFVAANSERSFNDLRFALAGAESNFEAPVTVEWMKRKVLFLPNFYPTVFFDRDLNPNRGFDDRGRLPFDVGCFGALRPMKNQLLQAITAMEFVDRRLPQCYLRFHINGTRCEQGGNNVLKNLQALFLGTRHILNHWNWVSHESFLRLLAAMDLGMQVSLSESFSIIAADMAAVGLPMVVSPEITWASAEAKANPTDAASIVRRMEIVWAVRDFEIWRNRTGLRRHSLRARATWLEYLQQ